MTLTLDMYEVQAHENIVSWTTHHILKQYGTNLKRDKMLLFILNALNFMMDLMYLSMMSTWSSSIGNGYGNKVSLDQKSWIQILCYPPDWGEKLDMMKI